MSLLHLLAIVFTIAALSSWLNKRYLKLPSAIGVMSVSLLFSLMLISVGQTGLVDISVAYTIVGAVDFKSLLLHGMLAFLLFAGGLSVNLDDLKSEKAPIAALSTLGVALSAFLTGGLFWAALNALGIDVPFIIALLFGAIISPTDAVAILGILRKVGVPKSLETKVVGESLFNDGVGVVVFFTIMNIAFGENPTTIDVIRSLGLEMFGGISLGVVLGWTVFVMLKAIDDYVVEILLTLALASGGYSLAELLHVSAPICVVVAGLIIGNHGREWAMSEKTLEHLDTFWELIDELLNAILFVLIGLKILTLSIDEQYVMAGIAGIGAVLLSRFVSVWIPIATIRHFRPFSPHVVKILTWGGLKGGISVALALALPVGEHTDLLVISTYVVVLFSVLVQGSTLPALLAYAKRP
jgi:CPA1 family monovalent cation:H+ antiporter